MEECKLRNILSRSLLLSSNRPLFFEEHFSKNFFRRDALERPRATRGFLPSGQADNNQRRQKYFFCHPPSAVRY